VSEHDSAVFRTFILVLVLLGVFMAIIITLANMFSDTETANSDPRVQAEISRLAR
jgi:hypothetical protein